jgi:general secretion pathway protein K
MNAKAVRGVALITVMLVLAIATVAVVSMSTARQMDIRRTENQLRAMQAWEYVYSLESWATGNLTEDLKDNELDGSNDRWHTTLPYTQLADAILTASLDDMQGRINLNNLLVEGEASAEDVRRLQRLLVNLGFKAELADAILDWMDDDMKIRYPHGAEDETYTRLAPPYRSANHLFSDVSELLLVQGITREHYQALRPYLYVADRYMPINVNTASAVVLRCLADEISEDEAESMYRAAGKPFGKIEDFLKDEAVVSAKIGRYGLSVNSEYFLLKGQIDMGKNQLWVESQLQRVSEGRISVVKRQRVSPLHG